MKKRFKDVWVSIPTIILTLIQLIAPIIFGKDFFNISLFISIFINVVAMLLINYNIKWLYNKNRNEEAERYKKEAPCTFQAIKFAFGIIISTALSIISVVGQTNLINVNINIGQVIVAWYLLPLLLVFVAIASLDAGFYNTSNILIKIKIVPAIIKGFKRLMFDSDNQKSFLENILFKIAIGTMIVVIIGYALYKIVSIFI